MSTKETRWGTGLRNRRDLGKQDLEIDHLLYALDECAVSGWWS